METQKQRTQIFLVLVPHRDVRLVLRNYSADLFKAGIAGAYHFPWAAPLAVLSHPFNADELKHCARCIREAAGGDKIGTVEAATAFPALGQTVEGCALFGPRLDLAITPNAFGSGASKVTGLFSPPVIGTCLMPETSTLPPPPQLSFRAAAVANMFWRPLRASAGVRSDGVIGYKWKIGKLYWLPSVKKKG
jgi:hypothetical protein